MAEISTVQELNEYFGERRKQQMELWTHDSSGQSLCALVSGDVGWLMFLREEGDAGFSTRNPNYNDEMIEYELENGQVDSYPSAWAMPIAELQKAIEHFLQKHQAAPWLVWNNDSGDGTSIGRQPESEKQ